MHDNRCSDSKRRGCQCSCGGTLHGNKRAPLASGGDQSGARLDPLEAAAWEKLLAAASAIQGLVPGTILVGGAEHRVSLDADHVLSDLRARYEAILATLEREAGWRTARRRAPIIILGSFEGIEQGIRQLIRTRPLETTEIVTASGKRLRIPTLTEITRIKAFLVLRRNTVRDHLDLVALASRIGTREAAQVLRHLDDYYTPPDDASGLLPVASQLARQLAEPRPVDLDSVEIKRFRGIDPRWSSWNAVEEACQTLAVALLEGDMAQEGEGSP